MAYRRFRSRRPYRRRSYRRRGYRSMRSKARTLSRVNPMAFNAALKVELKAFDKDIGDINIFNNASTADVIPLSDVTAGSSDVTRVGREIIAKGLTYRFMLTSGALQVVDQLVMIAIVLDRQPRGSAPTYAALFEDIKPFAFSNWDNRGRYRILKRWTQYVRKGELGGTLVDSGTYKVIQGYINLKGMKIRLSNSNVSDVNGLYLVALGDTATDDTAKPKLIGRSRLTFYDA